MIGKTNDHIKGEDTCLILTTRFYSIEGIYDTLMTCAQISKSAGGVGVGFQKIRGSGSYIAGTNGTSNGIVPMLRVYNDTARFVTQGGGKRNGSFAMYLEPWHTDILDFLDLRKNSGKEELRARDLFLGLWVCDLFMKRVEANGQWSLFCPNEAYGLDQVYGDEFEQLYIKYEREGRARRTMDAQKLWFAIMDAQIETGMPYMLYKGKFASLFDRFSVTHFPTLLHQMLVIKNRTKRIWVQSHAPTCALVKNNGRKWEGSSTHPPLFF